MANVRSDLTPGYGAAQPVPSTASPSAALPSQLTPGVVPTSTPQLVFPGDLESMQYWIKFSPYQYSRADRGQLVPTKGPASAHVFLPVPGNLTTSYSAEYVPTELGVMGVASKALSKEFMRAARPSEYGSVTWDKALTDLLDWSWKSLYQNAPGAVANIAMGLDPFGVANGVSVGTGIQRNPHLAMLYTGQKFRTHTFQYNFAARTPKEAQDLHQIIYIFKYAMSPSYYHGLGPGNHLFTYPDEWDITFSYPQFAIQPSVLTDFSVNYHGQGIPSYHYDHYPVNITIDLAFTETAILTKENIETGSQGANF